MSTEIFLYKDNDTLMWRNRAGQLHRTDGPAEISPKYKAWYKDGKKHRDGDLPAVEYVSIESNIKDQEWWRDGKKHRIGAPAVIYATGSVEWWNDGKLHREDGPAMEDDRGCKEWWLNGKKHRADGPAYIDPMGESEWWVDGNELTQEEFVNWQEQQRQEKLNQLISTAHDICQNGTPAAFPVLPKIVLHRKKGAA